MITQVLHCRNCHGTDIVKLVLSPEGKQQYKCRETAYDGRKFILDYAYPGQLMVPLEIEAAVRSLPNSSDWLRRLIIAAVQKEVLQDQDGNSRGAA